MHEENIAENITKPRDTLLIQHGWAGEARSLVELRVELITADGTLEPKWRQSINYQL